MEFGHQVCILRFLIFCDFHAVVWVLCSIMCSRQKRAHFRQCKRTAANARIANDETAPKHFDQKGWSQSIWQAVCFQTPSCTGKITDEHGSVYDACHTSHVSPAQRRMHHAHLLTKYGHSAVLTQCCTDTVLY